MNHIRTEALTPGLTFVMNKGLMEHCIGHMLCLFVTGSLCRVNMNTRVPPYARVIRSKTYRGYVKPRIANAIYNVIFD
jgi:hypothetical protein